MYFSAILLLTTLSMVYSAVLPRQILPPVYPPYLEAEIEQCYMIYPSTCMMYEEELSYNYETKMARVDYIYKVDMPDELEGIFIFRWDMEPPMAYHIIGKEKKDCVCTFEKLTESMPVLMVPEGSIYNGQTVMDDETVDIFWYNTSRYNIEYFVLPPDQAKEGFALPVSTVQTGSEFGDFYCNFTKVKAKEPKEKEFEVPECCEEAEEGKVWDLYKKPAGSVAIPTQKKYRAPAKLALGCILPPHRAFLDAEKKNTKLRMKI